mgnify:CR=1 FL=1
MEPVLKDWVWHVRHAPTSTYTTWHLFSLSEIFWFDSSTDLAFENYTKDYNILVPEKLIQSSQQDIQYVKDNLDRIVANKEFIMITDLKGNWKIRPNPDKASDFFTPWNAIK